MLIAPVMMGLHSYFVSRLLLGKGVAWNPQDRSERGLSVVEAFTYLGLLFAGGVVWGALIIVAAPGYFWWILPVLAGLILSVPVAVLSSRSTIGKWARRRGLLLTPEELAPPEELRHLSAALAADRAMETSFEAEAAASALPRTPLVVPRMMEPQRFDRLPPRPLIRQEKTVG
jgi:membrane glycosyltransferase